MYYYYSLSPRTTVNMYYYYVPYTVRYATCSQLIFLATLRGIIMSILQIGKYKVKVIE